MARRVLHDEYFKRAKAEGYLARSAYKLLEIQERFSLMRAGDRVLDLGCAPGSWLQVAERIVGARGEVVGVDLQEIEHAYSTAVRVVRGDVFALAPGELLAGGARFDVLLSDMAPSTSGHGDDLLSARLCRRALELVPAVLRGGGGLAMKVLEGGENPELLRETQRMFARVKATKPRASREVSREMYIVAAGFRAGAAS